MILLNIYVVIDDELHEQQMNESNNGNPSSQSNAISPKMTSL